MLTGAHRATKDRTRCPLLFGVMVLVSCAGYRPYQATVARRRLVRSPSLGSPAVAWGTPHESSPLSFDHDHPKPLHELTAYDEGRVSRSPRRRSPSTPDRVRHPPPMPWEPCPCWKSPRRCDRCLQGAISAVAPHCVGYAIAEHIARSRPHLINTPRFDDLPWPRGYDFAQLVRRWLSDVEDERALAVLVPKILAFAREGWEHSGNITAVREGRLPIRTWIRRIERAKVRP